MKLGIFPESFVSPHENQKKEKKKKINKDRNLPLRLEIYQSMR